MILAIQRLKEMSRGGSVLAKWTISYYFVTTLIAIVHSLLMTALVWRPLMTTVDSASLAVVAGSTAAVASRDAYKIEGVVVALFDSFVPNNIFNALSTNGLLAVLMCAIVVGYLIEGPNSSLLRATKEVDRIITIIITFLIKLAPIGVFFLILSNIMRLDIADVGQNLGVLIGASLTGMFIHLLIILPAIFYAVTRVNPYTYWATSAPAWVTAWGTASSAATLPVTMREVIKKKIPVTIAKFTVPLGCLVNMDG
jgi:Na+/H+-dicarboxylate symporter